MLARNVIFIDGLPGTGKTSLARWLTQMLQSQGQPARFISEYDLQHPLHWFTYHDGDTLLPPDFDSIALPDHIAISLDKWEQFQEAAQENSETLIIDGYPVLNSAGVFLWGDASRRLCLDYLGKVHDLIALLNAALIYLRTTDLDAALARKLRFLEQDDMVDFFMDSMERQPFLRRRGLTGKSGVYALWESVQWALESFYQLKLPGYLVVGRDTLDENTVRSMVLRAYYLK